MHIFGHTYFGHDSAIFRPILGHIWRENGLGPPNPTKELAHLVGLLGKQLSRNHVPEILRPEPPTSLLMSNEYIMG